jgi:hypothetical protein
MVLLQHTRSIANIVVSLSGNVNHKTRMQGMNSQQAINKRVTSTTSFSVDSKMIFPVQQSIDGKIPDR